MATTNGNRKILDLKRAEFCTPSPAASAAGVCYISSRHYRQQQLLLVSATLAYLYNPNEDAYVQIASPALATAVAAGACGCATAFSTGTALAASLTATSGTTSSITINSFTAVRDCRGYRIQILSGPNAGEVKTIARNTVNGTNTTFTFTAASALAFDATTTFRLLTPVWFVMASGTVVAGSFKKFDFCTGTWTTLSITGIPALGTDCRLLSTPSWIDDGFKSFSTGTATAGSTTTSLATTKTWTASQWINYQVRITGGTGAGQIRTISANTTNALTPSVAFSPAPDATSTFSIEGNDDFLYLMGNNAVTMYRYQISTNTWTTITPGVARAGTPGAGLTGHWIWGSTQADWTDETAIQNGRYFYSFRGAGGAILDRYDIAANTWAQVAYAPLVETFTTGSKPAYNGDFIYIQKDATGRWFRLNVATLEMDGWTTWTYPQGAAVVGDTCFDVTYRDGATEIVFIYMLLNTTNVMLRMMVI